MSSCHRHAHDWRMHIGRVLCALDAFELSGRVCGRYDAVIGYYAWPLRRCDWILHVWPLWRCDWILHGGNNVGCPRHSSPLFRLVAIECCAGPVFCSWLRRLSSSTVHSRRGAMAPVGRVASQVRNRTRDRHNTRRPQTRRHGAAATNAAGDQRHCRREATIK